MYTLTRYLLLDGQSATEQQRLQLVTSLFRQPGSLASSGIGTLVAACVCWRYTGSGWYVAWGMLSCFILGLRLALALAFHRNRTRLKAQAWAWLFLAGAITTAFAAGAGAGLAVLRADNLVATLYMATNVLSFAGGAAVRNSVSPLAAASQTTIVLGVTGIACLVSGTLYLQVFAALILLHLVAQFEIIRSLCRTTRSLIFAERRQASLNERLSEFCDHLEGANRTLTELSSTDGLTGLLNRRAFDAELAMQWSIASRDQTYLALLMIDADYFKRFNDRFGHLAGDEALRWLAQVLRATLHRPSDIVGRFGGEEFAVLLPETDIGAAVTAAERIRKALAQGPMPSAMPASWRLTVSIGAAAMQPKSEESCLTLVEWADQALYAAKRDGRDRVGTLRTDALVGAQSAAAARSGFLTDTAPLVR